MKRQKKSATLSRRQRVHRLLCMEIKHNHVMASALLEPLAPATLKMRIAAWISRKMFGKVISPLPLLYTRNDALMGFSLKIERILSRRIRLSESEKLLIKLGVSLQNGCSFCGDMALAQAFQKKLSRQKFLDLVNGKFDGPEFSERESLILAFIEHRMKGSVGDDLIHSMKATFTDTELVDIGWCIAAECYYNHLSLTFSIESDRLALAAQ